MPYDVLLKYMLKCDWPVKEHKEISVDCTTGYVCIQ